MIVNLNGSQLNYRNAEESVGFEHKSLSEECAGKNSLCAKTERSGRQKGAIWHTLH